MSRSTRFRSRRGVAVCIAAALALTVTALAATTSGAAVARAKEKVDKAAILRYGTNINDSGGVSFDPSQSSLSAVARDYWDLIYDTMVVLNPDGSLSPGLAAEWKTPDQNTIELTLRDGVKFTDGTPFNAAAVKAAWDRHIQIANSPTGTGSLTPPEIKNITSIEAVGDKTVRIHLPQPIAKSFIADDLTNSRWLAVPSPTAAAAGTLNQKPVGAGPYMLQSYTPGGDIVLTKNPNYYDPKVQKLAGFRFSNVATGPPAISALQAGSVDVIWNQSADTIPAIEAQKNLRVVNQPGVRINDLGLCVSRGIFQNKTARQAMQYAVDRDAINKAVLYDTGRPTAYFIPQSYKAGYNAALDKKVTKQYAYNPKKAKQMLQQAGVAPGTTVTMMTSNTPVQQAMADVVQAQLKEVGLNAEVSVSSNLPADAARLLPDILLVGIDPSLWPNAFERVSTLNQCNWTNPQLTADFAIVRDGSKTEIEQRKAYDDIAKIILDESPVVYTAEGPLLAAANDKVKGVDQILWPSGPVGRWMYIVKDGSA